MRAASSSEPLLLYSFGSGFKLSLSWASLRAAQKEVDERGRMKKDWLILAVAVDFDEVGVYFVANEVGLVDLISAGSLRKTWDGSLAGILELACLCLLDDGSDGWLFL